MSRAVLSACLALLAVLSATAAGCANAPPNPGLSDRPLAIALVQDARGSQLVVVDLQRFVVVRRVRLRSLCLSIDGDPRSRTVVTAQCGGPDRAADSVAGVWKPDDGGRLSYVRLGVPNPTSVAACDGRALVVHGFEQTEGVCASTVDLDSQRLAHSWHLPPSVLRPETASGSIVVPAARAGGRAGSVSRVLGVRNVAAIASLKADSATVVADAAAGRGQPAWVVYREGESPPHWSIVRLRTEAAASDHAPSTSAKLAGVRKGIYEAFRFGDVIALADADALDLSDPGCNVLLVDAASLKPRGVIRVKGTPSALRPWGDRLLVLDGLLGELLLFEPGATTPIRRVALGGSSLGTGDLTVFDRPAETGK